MNKRIRREEEWHNRNTDWQRKTQVTDDVRERAGVCGNMEDKRLETQREAFEQDLQLSIRRIANLLEFPFASIHGILRSNLNTKEKYRKLSPSISISLRISKHV
ncbi:Hypothetical predicted protein [Octopus vulgaris]|uniref:Uncharacterized protein n=1 Tax=Octopus vulgaris TaxID=6645 RepID=A0AA36AMF3_OCTVU|nr:Hypothetical predicted protein [Octopus vulgaris]